MNQTTQREQIEKLLKGCPNVLTPLKAVKWMPIGKNKIYEEIKKGNIEAVIYKGGFILSKDSLIDYLVKTSSDTGKSFTIGGKKTK